MRRTFRVLWSLGERGNRFPALVAIQGARIGASAAKWFSLSFGERAGVRGTAIFASPFAQAASAQKVRCAPAVVNCRGFPCVHVMPGLRGAGLAAIIPAFTHSLSNRAIMRRT